MLDLNFIRKNPKIIKEACKKRQVRINIDKILKLDSKKREIQKKVDNLRYQKNLISQKKQLTKKELERGKKIKQEIKVLEKKLAKLREKLNFLLEKLPNIPFPEVPVGKDERDNVVLEKIGKIPKFDFPPKDHLEIGEKLNLIDVKKAGKVSGTRFGYLKNELVLLQFAIINFTFENLIKKGFEPILPPVMIRPKIAWSMGYLEQIDDQEAYFIPKDNLYLIGTSEQTLGAMHTQETFEEKDLPKRYLGFSTCFRREAGSWGKDTRGIFRVHQFDKIEMFVFSKPEDSKKEHKFLLEIEKELMKKLELPFQVVALCTGDLSKPSAQTFDIETWFPSQKRYRETHSCSNCTDFQARRLNIKFKRKNGKKEFVHTLNGTAFALGRILIAILENYQKKDGRVRIPKVLQKYLSAKEIPFL